MPVTSFTPAQGAPSFASLVYPLRTVTSIATAANVTYTVAQVLGGKIFRDCAGSSRTDTLPTAAALVAAVPGAQVGTSFEFDIRNSGAANTLTIAAGSGGTTSGTMTVGVGSIRFFTLVFTNVTPGSEAYTLYSDGSATF
jgi:hypothetical protein